MSIHEPTTHRLSGAIALALAAGLGLGTVQAQAATMHVTSSADPGTSATCTLRQAIVTANHHQTAGSGEGTCRAGASGSLLHDGHDHIAFNSVLFPPGGNNTITLDGTVLTISGAHLNIDASANGSVTIDANHASGIIANTSERGYDNTLSLSHLTLRNGNVTTTSCTHDKKGGAVCTPYADLTITSSTITGNSASSGGAIYSAEGTITLTNTTVSGNSASGLGGAINTVSGDITLLNSTISGNTARHVGGVATNRGYISADNTILSGNIHGDLSSSYNNNHHDLIGNVANLNLGPLADNGGPTQTMAPQAGSAAIDAGDDGLCPVTDQRGVLRAQGAHCDIGAIEVSVPNTLSSIWASGQSATIWHDFASPLVIKVTDRHGQPAQAVTLNATPAAPGHAGAQCAPALTDNAGLAYVYCRANGTAGGYNVKITAAGWPALAPATFLLTNTADSDLLFRDGFDPPGPRISMLVANTAATQLALHVPNNLPDNQPVPLRFITNTHGKPLLRVDAVRRAKQTLFRVVHFAHGQPQAPDAWQAAPATAQLQVQLHTGSVTASIR